MRPVSLTLQAFGSYPGELYVDFARLSRHGVFSISGPTGAGKSTIFDALVYALYDDLPGFRVDGNVRSQFADPSTPTSVSLDFVVHGERWRIERRPTQPVRRQRGAGAPIERKSTVVLGRVGGDGELAPGSTSTRKEEVKRRIDALVGLTKEQFEQVVLIPQGRFEEVLKSDTSKRAPLLRRLFPVEVFTRLTESLRSIALSRQVEYEEAARARSSLVERLQTAYEAAIRQLPDDLRDTLSGQRPDAEQEPLLDAPCSPAAWTDRLGVRVQELTTALGRVEELVAQLASTSEKARLALEEGRRSAADWDQWKMDLAVAASFADEERDDEAELASLERARRLSDLRGALGEWTDARRRLSQLEPEVASLVDGIGAAWRDEPGALAPDAIAPGAVSPGVTASGDPWSAACADAHAAGLMAERAAADARRLAGEVARFERLVEVEGLLDGRRLALEERRLELAERALKLDAEEQSVALVSEETQRLRTEVTSLGALSEAVVGLEREHQMASRRAAAIAGLRRIESELVEAVAELARATSVAEAVRASWRDGLAGRLAQLLEDGAPCPTCGAIDHPAPAVLGEDRAGDEELAAAEAARDEAIRLQGVVEQRAAAARGVIDALAETRPVEAVEADLAERREALGLVRDAAERLEAVAAEEARRRGALVEARQVLGSDERSLEVDGARLGADRAAHERDVAAFVEVHGALESPAARAAARAEMAADFARLAGVLKEVEAARDSLRHCMVVVEPVARELGVIDPEELFLWLLDPSDIEARSAELEVRRARREDVRRRIAEYEARAERNLGGGAERPDVCSLEVAAQAAQCAHDSLLERRAVLADRAAVLSAGPDELASADRVVDAARRGLEEAKTVADRCAGLGGGPVSLRLSLENWVLADYLRQVLVQANHRLDTMTEGRFALQLSDGVTDGRKPWGLDLSVFDANTGQVRPATTLSGGETFMAALALALGLADVVSGGSNREVGALFVDEGFGSLDPQSLDAVVDVLRSLEDGGRIVGVISHVRELQQALPSGITVEPSAHGSVATLHYPPD